MVTDSRFHLDSPPVKRVALTVSFQAEPRLQGWHLDEFFRETAGRYLSREEVAPRPDNAFEFLSASGAWPIPKTQFVSKERSLAVQGEELEVVWNFGDEGEKAYPGFDSLMEELASVITRLVTSVRKHDVEITTHEVECYYINEISGMLAADYAVGVLTDWADVTPRTLPKEGYVGVRLHACGDTEEHQCSSLVMVDSSDDDGSPILSLRVGRSLSEDENAEEAMQQAHDELIALFRTYTPDRLRAQWGES